MKSLPPKSVCKKMKPQQKQADIRIPAGEAARMMGRTQQVVIRRRAAGDWISPGQDRAYGLREILAFVPKLWDALSALRLANAKLTEQANPAQASKHEAQRSLINEKLRAAKRANDEAEGRIVDMEEIRRSDEVLFATLREHVAGISQAVILKLALPDHAAKTVNDEVAAALDRVATIMEKRDNS